MKQILGSIHSSYKAPEVEGAKVPLAIARNPESYRHLTVEEGRKIALAALERYDAMPESDDFIPQEVLTNLAKVVPGALKGMEPLLFERRLAFADVPIFRDADVTTRDQLISLVESGTSPFYTREELLTALAWIGDETVQARFQHWRTTPPAWRISVIDPLTYYTTRGGWELTTDGRRRDLYYYANHDLVSAQTAPSEAVREPVSVITPHEGTCEWCGLPLFLTLFDINLQDSRMQFLGMQGTRLRLVLCANCSLQGQPPIFTEVDGEGKSVWSALTEAPHGDLYIPNEDEEEEILENFPRRALVLGQVRRTPFMDFGSHIGGCPGWVQFADYPSCPKCHQLMKFVGQYLYEVEAYIYAFLCASCGLATTCYQQT